MNSDLKRIFFSSLTVFLAVVFAASLCASAHAAKPADDNQEASWQDLMAIAATEADKLDFASSEKTMNAAAAKAEQLSLAEQFLTFSQLGGILEVQAKYAEAEQLYRRWLEKTPFNSIYNQLALVLMKQNRLEESFKILHEHPMEPSDQFKLGDTWMKKEIQVEVRKNWKPPLRPISNSTQVVFCVSTGLKPAVFVTVSSDDKKADLAAINAIEHCSFKLPSFITEPAVVRFVFDYNTAPVPPATPLPKGILSKNKEYRHLRDRLAWQDEHLGKEHIEQASTLCSAANILKELGNLPAAETAYRKALEILDAKHATTFATFTSCRELGIMLTKQKNYKDAEAFLQRECKLTEQFYGPKSSNYTEVQEQLAKVQRKLKK